MDESHEFNKSESPGKIKKSRRVEDIAQSRNYAPSAVPRWQTTWFSDSVSHTPHKIITTAMQSARRGEASTQVYDDKRVETEIPCL